MTTEHDLSGVPTGTEVEQVFAGAEVLHVLAAGWLVLHVLAAATFPVLHVFAGCVLQVFCGVALHVFWGVVLHDFAVSCVFFFPKMESKSPMGPASFFSERGCRGCGSLP